MTNNTCQISFELIDKNVSRLNALFVLIMLIFSLFYPNYFIGIFLLMDFLFRWFFKKWFILSFISRKILDILKIKKKTTNASPKHFAAKIWFLMSLFILWFYFHNLIVCNVFIFIFIFFLVLDLFFDFCFWCFIYNKIIIKFKK